MSTSLERELRRLKEAVEILTGERGAAGRPERAVRLREVGSGGLGVTKISQLENDKGYVTAEGAAQAAPIQEIQAGANVSIDTTDPRRPVISTSGGSALSDTDDLPEGATNLYYTNGRAIDAVASAIDEGIEPAGDPYWDDVASLLHFDEDFSDDAGMAWTTIGGVSISDDDPRFGDGCALFNGSSGYLRSSASPGVNFTASVYTVEFWMRCDDTPDGSALLTNEFSSSGDRLPLVIGFSSGSPGSPGGSRLFVGRYAPWEGFVSSFTPTIGAWYHVAVVRVGTTISLYVDGVRLGFFNLSSAPDPSTRQLLIGRRWDTTGTARYFNGAIDDLRITPGVARYTSNFVPPSAPFPNFYFAGDAGIGLDYDPVTRTIRLINIDKGSDAVEDHVGEANPHPQYTTEAEAAAAAPIQSIQAGDNVTIDTTDPRNPVINAYGGTPVELVYNRIDADGDIRVDAEGNLRISG